MKLQKDLREFIELLTFHRVEYLVVGGHAVAFHGYPRTTGDIDFWIEANDENARRMVRVLDQFGFADTEQIHGVLRRPGKLLQLGVPPNRIDVLTSLSGVDFGEVSQRALLGELDGLSVRFIDLESLLRNKRSTGRPKDLADIAELERVAGSSSHEQ